MTTLFEEALLEQVRESMMPILRRADRAASDWLADRLAELGVSMAEFRLVGALLGESEGIPQNVLAKRLGIEAATLSVVLAKLEAKGVVIRTPDPVDTRIRRVTTSRRGSRFGEIKVLLEMLERFALAGLDPADVDTAKRVLLTVEKNLAALAERTNNA
jgi:DNA-binding MarR family transcriptional regulator